jgi:hypothetical protein
MILGSELNQQPDKAKHQETGGSNFKKILLKRANPPFPIITKEIGKKK